MITNLTPSQWAALRNVLSALMGAAVMTGLISATGAQQLVDSIVQVGTAVGLILTAGATIVTTINAMIAAHKASPDQQKIAVRSLPNTMVVTTTPQSSDASVASKVAALPEVAEVLSTPNVAANTVSDKVVATPST